MGIVRLTEEEKSRTGKNIVRKNDLQVSRKVAVGVFDRIGFYSKTTTAYNVDRVATKYSLEEEKFRVQTVQKPFGVKQFTSFHKLVHKVDHGLGAFNPFPDHLLVWRGKFKILDEGEPMKLSEQRSGLCRSKCCKLSLDYKTN
jgi:hypothetical protein